METARNETRRRQSATLTLNDYRSSVLRVLRAPRVTPSCIPTISFFSVRRAVECSALSTASTAVCRARLLNVHLTAGRSNAPADVRSSAGLAIALFPHRFALPLSDARIYAHKQPMHRHDAARCSDFAMLGMRRHYACAPRTLLGTDGQADPLCPSTTTSRSSAET